jgi:hypothetical protein
VYARVYAHDILMLYSQHQVVALSGEDARRTFFNEKGLSFTQGYKLFMGGVSQILQLRVLLLY